MACWRRIFRCHSERRRSRSEESHALAVGRAYHTPFHPRPAAILIVRTPKTAAQMRGCFFIHAFMAALLSPGVQVFAHKLAEGLRRFPHHLLKYGGDLLGASLARHKI